MLNQIKNEIKCAYANMEPKEALKRIAEIWAHIDDAAGLAQARTNLLLMEIEEPSCCELPIKIWAKWRRLGPLSFIVKKKFLESIYFRFPQLTDWKIQIYSLAKESINIDIDTGKEIVYLIVESCWPSWPNIKVSCLIRDIESGDRETGTFHDMHTLLDYMEHKINA